MINVEEKFDVLPVCPHCKSELQNIHCQQMAGILGKRYVYFCPDCKSVLGVSHRKGFWMG
ncbi:hypothetical protein H8E88_27095 [candidate division KSB1 bacterium]|nr:hypothetical protein [candidate division KSB1 bacterium]